MIANIHEFLLFTLFRLLFNILFFFCDSPRPIISKHIIITTLWRRRWRNDFFLILRLNTKIFTHLKLFIILLYLLQKTTWNKSSNIRVVFSPFFLLDEPLLDLIVYFFLTFCFNVLYFDRFLFFFLLLSLFLLNCFLLLCLNLLNPLLPIVVF